MSNIFYQPKSRIISNDGSEVGAGYKFYFYQTGTTTPITTYSDPALTVANTNPVIADAYGYFNLIYVSDFSLVKVVVKDSSDNLIYTVDPVNPAGSSSITLNDLGVRPTSYWGLTSGTSSAYTLVANPTLPAYSNTNTFFIQFHIACAAAPTLNIDSLGALNIKKYTEQGTKIALQAGDVQAAQRYIAINDGVDIVVLNPRNTNIYTGTSPTLTIATGIVTLTNGGASYRIDTEGSAASDDLDTINGGVDGEIIIISNVNNSRTVNVTTSGNISISSGVTFALKNTKSRLVLQYNSTLALWVEISRTSYPNYYSSGQQTISSAGGLTLPHNLGKIPDLVLLTYQCISADNGYSVNDLLLNHTFNNTTSSVTVFGAAIIPDATNLTVRFAVDTPVIPNKTTGNAGAMDINKWKAIFTAYVFSK
jgi:hypothetical protein